MSRYIDADKAKEKLGVVRGGYSCFLEEDRPYYDILSETIKMINEMPTADVRENVKGRWVEVVDKTEMYDKEGVKTWGMLFQCNQCGFVLNAIEGHTGQYNYCPNCGADLRGES